VGARPIQTTIIGAWYVGQIPAGYAFTRSAKRRLDMSKLVAVIFVYLLTQCIPFNTGSIQGQCNPDAYYGVTR